MQAVYLLQKLCTYVDGAQTTILYIVGSLIEFSLHSNDVNAITEEQYPKLLEFKESAIVKDIMPNIRVETCILVIAGIQEQLGERYDLM